MTDQSHSARATKNKDKTTEQQKPRNGSDSHFCPRPWWRARLGRSPSACHCLWVWAPPTKARRQQLPQDLTSRNWSTEANTGRLFSVPPGDIRMLERSAILKRKAIAMWAQVRQSNTSLSSGWRRESVLFNIIPCTMLKLTASSFATFPKASRILSKAHSVALTSTLKILLYSSQS